MIATTEAIAGVAHRAMVQRTNARSVAMPGIEVPRVKNRMRKVELQACTDRVDQPRQCGFTLHNSEIEHTGLGGIAEINLIWVQPTS